MDVNDKPASKQIDAIIGMHPDWKGKKLAELRAVITVADAGMIEEVKWKKPSKPEGVPVWSHNGNVCIADTLKNAVRLTFPKGARVADPQKLFNARLDSSINRAIDFFKDSKVEAGALTEIVREAVQANQQK